MARESRTELQRTIVEEIAAQNYLIKSLAKSTQPIAPDRAIGRLTRMEAINSKAISEASLASAKSRLAKLETALNNIDRPDFGICMNCSTPIPPGRIMLIPESTLCVHCADNR